MANTFSKIRFHVVFATKNREHYLDERARNLLFPAMGKIIKDLGGMLLEVGGTEDHVHLLAGTPPSLPVSELAKRVKGATSHWLNESSIIPFRFAWQRGYSAFSVSESQVERVARYIASQAEHHRHLSFQEELERLLRAHGVRYDTRYLSG